MSAVIKNAVYRGQLLALAAANIVFCWLTFTGRDLLTADWTTIAKDWAAAAPPTFGLIAIGAFSGLIDPMWKARIVFLRWSNPLPGSKAFSYHMHRDPRISADRLEKKHGPLPTAPKEQNALWYRLYKPIADRAEVSHVHRDFLMYRDLTVLAVLSFFVAVPAAYFMASPASAGTLALIFGAEFLLFRQAAAHYGTRMVTTVLALRSAQR